MENNDKILDICAGNDYCAIFWSKWGQMSMESRLSLFTRAFRNGKPKIELMRTD